MIKRIPPMIPFRPGKGTESKVAWKSLSTVFAVFTTLCEEFDLFAGRGVESVGTLRECAACNSVVGYPTLRFKVSTDLALCGCLQRLANRPQNVPGSLMEAFGESEQTPSWDWSKLHSS
jgi:hypothetical protein